MKEITITLTKYERDNLLFLLNICGYPFSEGIAPFQLMNTGDWIGQIAQKLMGEPGLPIINLETDSPNLTREELLKRLEWYQEDREWSANLEARLASKKEE